ncbi:hypothetical protein MCAMS1_00192 [biofilm metagenome]
MSRYESTRNRKSRKSTFIFPILISFFVGVGGILYVYENYRISAQKTNGIGKEGSEQLRIPDKFPIQVKTVTETDLIINAPVQADSLSEGKTNTFPQTQEEQRTDDKQTPLPDLLSSDSVVRQAIIKLSPGLTTWLNANQLIRRFFLIVNDFSQGQRVSRHMSFMRLQEPFYVEQHGNDLYIAPKNYQRYKLLTEAIKAVDAKKAANLYRRFRPLLLQVFAEQGYEKDMSLESVVKKAAAEIIAAPVIEGQIRLIRPSVYYRFADPKMKAFNPVQKQMIRIGPENTRIIQAKCREILVELGKVDLN